ncbi:alpha/beta fold hydrolase [Iningainema tapete]|uniref:Alpha/beta hydrolase n=1 Tax=Iningainema tapete BLCC-T55 TaxID=2748662 RepID=A0A8J6XSS1_9CYAN|nr:alpha/beta hydrolase [Iningainema tapete]MBD2777775.1 alpha/beta hydrolase [Iningainema tapete BLCC-T55]
MDLHYEIQGNGEPIVFLHCGGADSRDWEFIVPCLAQHYRCITYDGRGTGKSPSPIEVPDYVEDLKNLLDFLDIDNTVLVGHSIGGRIACDFALAYPQRVSKLVLIAPGLKGYQFSPELVQRFEQIQSTAPNVEKMAQLSLELPIYQVVMASPQRSRMIEMTTHNTRRGLEWEHLWKNLQVWGELPAIPPLNELAVKTLFIIGTQDSQDCFRIADLFKQVPEIRFAHIEGADHMPTLTHSLEVSRLIKEFLDESK